jgi:hypothetical protein
MSVYFLYSILASWQEGERGGAKEEGGEGGREERGGTTKYL